MIGRRRRTGAAIQAARESLEPWLYGVEPAPPPRRRVSRRSWLILGVVAALLLGWGTFHLLTAASYFRVDRVEISGIAYLTRDEVRELAGIDSATTVWTRRSTLVEAIEAHPLVVSATVERELPRTLVLSIDEAKPIGLVASPLVVPVDRRGNELPVDPTSPVLDLPVLSVVTPRAAASWGLRLLAQDVGHMADVAPEFYAVVSEARLDDREVTLLLGDSGLRVRYRPPVSEARLRQAMIAINDAAERLPERAPREIDLRFEDQVVVRTAAAVAGPGGSR